MAVRDPGSWRFWLTEAAAKILQEQMRQTFRAVMRTQNGAQAYASFKKLQAAIETHLSEVRTNVLAASSAADDDDDNFILALDEVWHDFQVAMRTISDCPDVTRRDRDGVKPFDLGVNAFRDVVVNSDLVSGRLRRAAGQTLARIRKGEEEEDSAFGNVCRMLSLSEEQVRSVLEDYFGHHFLGQLSRRCNEARRTFRGVLDVSDCVLLSKGLVNQEVEWIKRFIRNVGTQSRILDEVKEDLVKKHKDL